MLPVNGYTDQPDRKVELVNDHKVMEEKILRHLDWLAKLNPDVDPRWLAKGRTAIEEGFMFLNRAVFQPKRVKLEGDRD